jgi:hypothetical protein
MSSLGAAIILGRVWQRRCRCPVVPRLNASPFLVGGKARRGLMLLRSVVEGTSLPSCSRLVRTVVCVCVLCVCVPPSGRCTPVVFFLFNEMKRNMSCVL